MLQKPKQAFWPTQHIPSTGQEVRRFQLSRSSSWVNQQRCPPLIQRSLFCSLIYPKYLEQKEANSSVKFQMADILWTIQLFSLAFIIRNQLQIIRKQTGVAGSNKTLFMDIKTWIEYILHLSQNILLHFICSTTWICTTKKIIGSQALQKQAAGRIWPWVSLKTTDLEHCKGANGSFYAKVLKGTWKCYIILSILGITYTIMFMLLLCFPSAEENLTYFIHCELWYLYFFNIFKLVRLE